MLKGCEGGWGAPRGPLKGGWLHAWRIQEWWVCEPDRKLEIGFLCERVMIFSLAISEICQSVLIEVLRLVAPQTVTVHPPSVAAKLAHVAARAPNVHARAPQTAPNRRQTAFSPRRSAA